MFFYFAHFQDDYHLVVGEDNSSFLGDILDVVPIDVANNQLHEVDCWQHQLEQRLRYHPKNCYYLLQQQDDSHLGNAQNRKTNHLAPADAR